MVRFTWRLIVRNLLACLLQRGLQFVDPVSQVIEPALGMDIEPIEDQLSALLALGEICRPAHLSPPLSLGSSLPRGVFC
jgi:hypothetical protein